MKKVKIFLSMSRFKNRVSIDGVDVEGVTNVMVIADALSPPRIVIDLLPESIEVEGEIEVVAVRKKTTQTEEEETAP